MTSEQLKQILPHSTPENRNKYLDFLNKYMSEYAINIPLRQAAFIAQIGHESGSLRYVSEIASGKAYEGRKDLGNVFPGDGERFKGRGLIQITGRSNYFEMGKILDIDLVKNPELLEEPEYAVSSTCCWWKIRGLNELSDDGNFRKVTKIINGGYNGLSDRKSIYERAKTVLKVC